MPPPLTKRRSASPRTASTTAARRSWRSRTERRFSSAHVRPGVRQPGDLCVVEHDAAHVEPDAGGRPHDGAGLGGRARRRAAHAEVDRADPQRRVDVERHPEARHVVPERVAQEADVLDGVHRHRDLPPQVGVGRDGPQRLDVRGGVGDEDVAHAGGGQPHRLRYGIRHDAGEAGTGEHPLQQPCGTAPTSTRRGSAARRPGARGRRRWRRRRRGRRRRGVPAVRTSRSPKGSRADPSGTLPR